MLALKCFSTLNLPSRPIFRRSGSSASSRCHARASAAGSRGLATGRYFNLDGELVATVVQEGIIKHFPSRR